MGIFTVGLALLTLQIQVARWMKMNFSRPVCYQPRNDLVAIECLHSVLVVQMSASHWSSIVVAAVHHKSKTTHEFAGAF